MSWKPKKPAARYVDRRSDLTSVAGAEIADHLVCDRCWELLRPEGRLPVRVKRAPRHACCRCGAPTSSGIYVPSLDVPCCRGEGPVHAGAGR